MTTWTYKTGFTRTVLLALTIVIAVWSSACEKRDASSKPAADARVGRNARAEPMGDVVLAIHGGAISEEADLSAERRRDCPPVMEAALRAGWTAMAKPGASSLDGVEAAVRVLEDSPLFNAGKGAVFNFDGRNELDASIMEGKTLRAGAVASVTVIKNPISAARAVMENSRHVLLMGRGAEVFATKQGLEIVDPSYFWTETRWKQLQDDWKEAELFTSPPKVSPKNRDEDSEKNPTKKTSMLPTSPATRRYASAPFGTVGAIARDAQGNLAAATSTGGLSGKMYGRVGDSPIIGAGTYADNEGCAVSATGHGEYFIRYAVAHDINALIKYKGQSARQASEEVVGRKLRAAGGRGGVIVLDAKGNFSATHNTYGVYHGCITRAGKTHVWFVAQ